VRRLWRRLTAASAIAAVAIAAATAAASAATTVAPLPPAPAGFADSLTSLYANLYMSAQTVDQKTGQVASRQLTPATDFTQQVAALAPQDLAALYEATRQDSTWDQVAPSAQQLVADTQAIPPGAGVPAAASLAATPRVSPSAGSATAVSAAATSTRRATLRVATAGTTAVAFPPPEPVGSFPGPPPAFEPSIATIFAEMLCVAGPNPFAYYSTIDSAIYVADSLRSAADFLDDITTDIHEVAGKSGPNPAKYISAAFVLAAETLGLSLDYAHELADDCYDANAVAQHENTDETAVDSFNLEQQNAATMAATQSSINTIHDQVHVVQQTVNAQLTLNIRRALSQPTTSPRNINYELPGTVGGNLDSTPIGVQAVVTAAYNATKQAGLPITAVATSNLTAGNSALTARNYKTAWLDYQLAYQALR
jgi:hypothetical protein